MKEFIFTWRIENISFCWHKIKEEISSPSFVADTLKNTVWRLGCYPKGRYDSYPEWLSFYLYRDRDEGPSYLFNCEFSCVSANNLTLASCSSQPVNVSVAREFGIGRSKFLLRHEVFVQKKALYLPRDTLTLRCRIWKNVDGVDEYGQSFGCTRLEIEKILSVKVMNPKINNHQRIILRSKEQNHLLLSVDVSIKESSLKIKIQPCSRKKIKFSTIKFSTRRKNRKPIKFFRSRTGNPCKEVWRPKTNVTIGKKLQLKCEFLYSTGKITKSIEKVSPCLFRFPEFSLNCILSCIPSGKISDFSNIYEGLWDFYVKQIFCDVELKTETTSFCVHKTVLCARSPVFLAMFTNDMNENLRKCVKIEDLEDFTLGKLIKFLYTDSLEEIQWDTALELYYSADKYQVALLKSLCGSYFLNNIDDFKVYELLMLADRHSDSNLKRQVEDYIVSYRDRLFRSIQWNEFSKKQPLWAARIMIREYGSIQEEGNISSYPNAIDDFRSLHQNGMFRDVVIQTATATFFAHKIMLCAGSSRLMEVFTNGQTSEPLKLDDLEDDIIARLLAFLHTDSLGDLNVEIATNLYKAAVAYQIERLKIKCSCFFIENLVTANATNLLRLAHEHKDIKLKSLVEDFNTNNSSKLVKTKPKRVAMTRSKKYARHVNMQDKYMKLCL